MAKKTVNVEVEVVPTSGKPTTTKVTMEAGATVGDALEKAGVSAKDHDLALNGAPAKASTPIPTTVKIVAKVRTTERVAGS